MLRTPDIVERPRYAIIMAACCDQATGAGISQRPLVPHHDCIMMA